MSFGGLRVEAVLRGRRRGQHERGDDPESERTSSLHVHSTSVELFRQLKKRQRKCQRDRAEFPAKARPGTCHQTCAGDRSGENESCRGSGFGISVLQQRDGGRRRRRSAAAGGPVRLRHRRDADRESGPTSRCRGSCRRRRTGRTAAGSGSDSDANSMPSAPRTPPMPAVRFSTNARPRENPARSRIATSPTS